MDKIWIKLRYNLNKKTWTNVILIAHQKEAIDRGEKKP